MGSTKQQILTILRQDKGIISGEKLANNLEVSRTAVWKAVRELEKKWVIRLSISLMDIAI